MWHLHEVNFTHFSSTDYESMRKVMDNLIPSVTPSILSVICRKFYFLPQIKFSFRHVFTSNQLLNYLASAFLFCRNTLSSLLLELSLEFIWLISPDPLSESQHGMRMTTRKNTCMKWPTVADVDCHYKLWPSSGGCIGKYEIKMEKQECVEQLGKIPNLFVSHLSLYVCGWWTLSQFQGNKVLMTRWWEPLSLVVKTSAVSSILVFVHPQNISLARDCKSQETNGKRPYLLYRKFRVITLTWRFSYITLLYN